MGPTRTSPIISIVSQILLALSAQQDGIAGIPFFTILKPYLRRPLTSSFLLVLLTRSAVRRPNKFNNHL